MGKSKLKKIAVGNRGTDYLRWRFLKLPHRANKIFAIFDYDKKSVRGYIVYRYREYSIEIIEFFYDQDKKIISAMFLSFLRFARLSGATTITIALLENKKVAFQLKKFGFTERKEGDNVLIYLPNKLISKEPFIKDKDNWLLFHSDDDDI